MTWRERLRVFLRLVPLAVITAVSAALLLAAIPLKRLPAKTRARWVHIVFGSWSRLFLAVLRVRVTQEGPTPSTPFFLVMNHLSYIDIPLIASRANAVFIAKAEIERWPVIGPICRWADTVFVQRELKRDIPRVLQEINRRLAEDRGVVLFPEGTSSAGAEVAAFRPPLLATAAEAGYPVSYASISYETPAGERPAHLAVCWWGGMTFGKHFLELLAVPRFDATVTFGTEPILDDDRKRLAERLHAAVNAQFQPTVALEEM